MLAGYCTFFIGGEETTASGIAASTYMLLQRSALRERMRTQHDKLPGATREFLRLAAPFRYVTRIASRDSVLCEQTVASGSRVILMLGAANRDPSAFTNPDEIDPDRAGPDSPGIRPRRVSLPGCRTGPGRDGDRSRAGAASAGSAAGA